MTKEKEELTLRALGKVEYRGSITVSRERSISAEVSKNVWVKDQMGLVSNQRYTDEDEEMPNILDIKNTLGEELDSWESEVKRKFGLTQGGNRSTKKKEQPKKTNRRKGRRRR